MSYQLIRASTPVLVIVHGAVGLAVRYLWCGLCPRQYSSSLDLRP